MNMFRRLAVFKEFRVKPSHTRISAGLLAAGLSVTPVGYPQPVEFVTSWGQTISFEPGTNPNVVRALRNGAEMGYKQGWEDASRVHELEKGELELQVQDAELRAEQAEIEASANELRANEAEAMEEYHRNQASYQELMRENEANSRRLRDLLDQR